MPASQALQLLLPTATITNIDKEIMKKGQLCNPESIIGVEEQAIEILDLAKKSFAKIAPFWPLKNLIAVNPLQGLEDLPIEDALKMGAAYFQQTEVPAELERINILTIKWLQVFFDEGQATISMPLRGHGLYTAWSKLAIHDNMLHNNNQEAIHFLQTLPEKPEQAITACLLRLEIAATESELFMTLLLTTLAGWASYIKYRTEWASLNTSLHPITQVDYIAVRLAITALLWPQAKNLISWHRKALEKSQNTPLAKIQAAEEAYQLPLLKKLSLQAIKEQCRPNAQLVFCIDVRSEPFRRALELTGDYETLGFAGFFGIPVQITNATTGASYASCPVLLKPKCEVTESPYTTQQYLEDQKGYKRLTDLKKLYYSLQYTFSTPFALVEALGPLSGVWMYLKSMTPILASKIKSSLNQIIRKPQEIEPLIDNIPFAEQCMYAESALRTMGLTDHFASLIVFCGHGGSTQNNAYASALDCGACGGQHGASNARILAAIMNTAEVKSHLAKNGINIPETTRFIAAEHNTTTDEVTLYNVANNTQINLLKQNLSKARNANNLIRIAKLTKHANRSNASSAISIRSEDWAQVRPEWGQAKNTAFIVAPRDLTSAMDLDGRCFLHSYDYTQDPEEKFLTTILTAPMIVAEWINMQYLFSTIDNVAYGAGSKITKNITSKIGVMQGNASDLMTGLPLQSVYSSDDEPYHDPQRLMAIVYAPTYKIDKVIQEQAILKKLFGNGWIKMTAIDPESHTAYMLNRSLYWEKALN